MRFGLLFLAAAMLASAAIDGTVINRTTGKPQPGVTIALVDLRKGMAPVTTVRTDAQGKFSIDFQLAGPALLQSTWDGVAYNKMLQPGAPTSGLQAEVYNASSKPSTAKVEQDMILIEPSGQALQVREAFIFRNQGNLSYNDAENGTLRFFLPPGAEGKVKVTVNAQGLPIQRQAEKTGQPNVYRVKYPIRPGETQFQIEYAMAATQPAKFTSRVLHDGPVRLIVPPGVTATGDQLESLGEEPQSKALIYSVKGKEFTAEIQGTGALNVGGGGGGGGEATSSDDAPQIQESLPRIYDKVYVILALALAILLLGFVIQWRKRAPERVVQAVAAKARGKGAKG